MTQRDVSAHDQLLDRLRRRDRRALEEIYAGFGPTVLHVARRITHDDHLAEDVTQEVFLALWDEPWRVDTTRGDLPTYLVVVTRQRAIDHVRREQRWRDRHDRAARQRPHLARSTEDDVAVDVLRHAAADERRRAVHRAVTRLPAPQRDAVTLAYFGGRTFREVAREQGIPEGTAKSRMRAAMRQLQRDLRPVAGRPVAGRPVAGPPLVSAAT